MTRQWWCTTCRRDRDEPVQCAPNRCYCSHPECPAYHSYTNPREQQVAPITVRQTTDTAWAERDAPTWIDNL